ncbi:MAG TPA: AgmX/PglI C-terminal domain-containing protein [Anaeromyxobacteraceae bacterium]|nr:AgmX/PglI C-terminal domain-containing protein [Anaeromyxobacteraceae bacterium]
MHIDDPALESGEWLFKKTGKVFGPIPSARLAQMLYKGELDAETPVSQGDGTWQTVADVPIFMVHARKAQAALRVEREVTGARLLRQRKHRRGLVALLVVLVGAMGGGGYAAWYFAAKSAQRNPLLEDFGSGIRISVAATVGAGHRADDEIAVDIEQVDDGRGAGRRGGAGVAGATGGGRGTADGGDLVAAQYDPARIQAVVAREQRTLAECFKEEARRSPDFSGDIPLEFAVGNDGRVAQLWIDVPRFKSGPLKDCLVRKLAAWRFDAFPGQRPTVALSFGIGR